jgi:DHA2 family multidrug resistance protein
MTEGESRHRVLITAVVMLAAVMQILDTTIVTVALPHMQGQLGATADEIGWVLTSYLISSGIFMPLTGFMTDRFGQRNYLIVSIAGFTAASMLCGLATSLDQIVIFRLLQGVAGAGLVPSAQAILVNAYPAEERGRAMAIFGVGAMIGPIMGPTLGGYLTQVLDWRWTFFINLPVGILTLLGTWAIVPDSERRERHADWWGFGFLVIAVATMQYVLDRGQELGWFGSHLIQVLTVVGLFATVCLILRNWEMGSHAIFDLRLFKDRNFGISALILATFMFSMYGVLELQPLMLESSLGYPAFKTGLVLAPRGAASMLSMFLAGRLITRVGAKPLIVSGIACTLFGTLVTTWYTPEVDPWWIIWPILIQGFGLGLVFVPLATVSFATLPREQAAEAAGIRQLSRSIAWNQMAGHVTPFSSAVSQYLAPLGLSWHSPMGGAMLAQVVGKQAHFLGILDAFDVMAWTVVLGLPLLLLIRKGIGKHRKLETA